jgi:hypothetical protein
VTMVPLVTVGEESVRLVAVVAAPKAKLSGADTVARRRPRTASKMPEKERLPDFRYPERLLHLVRCDDMLISVTTSDVTRRFQADGCALRKSSGGWWPRLAAALLFC